MPCRATHAAMALPCAPMSKVEELGLPLPPWTRARRRWQGMSLCQRTCCHCCCIHTAVCHMLLLPSSAPQPVASAHAYRPPLPLFLETRTGGREGEREREREICFSCWTRERQREKNAGRENARNSLWTHCYETMCCEISFLELEDF
jgi:hypothetical protein